MAMLGFGDYLCEACRFFDADGDDGNHPTCERQGGILYGRAVRVGEECPFGFRKGVPYGYKATEKHRKERYEKVMAMIGTKEGK